MDTTRLTAEAKAIRQRHVKQEVDDTGIYVCGFCRYMWPCDAVTLLDRLAWLQEQVKGVACEVCWTTSWEPIEKVEDADGVNTKLYGKALTRCEYCWQEKIYTDRLARAEQQLAQVRAALVQAESAMSDIHDDFPDPDLPCNCGLAKAIMAAKQAIEDAEPTGEA